MTPARILPAGPPAFNTFDMPDASHTWEERGGWLVKRLSADFNLQPFQAAGIVGNLGFESAGFTKLREIGQPEGQGGYGWAQWTGPRRVLFLLFAAQLGLDWQSDAANYGYLMEELRGNQHNTIRQVSQTSNDADAVFSVGQTYERPGGTTSTFLPGFDGRLKYARRALAGAGAAGQAGTPAPVPIDNAGPVSAAIKALQTALVPYGYNIAVDGIWGTGTEAALQAYLDQTGA
jgi:hypothetical protein